MEDVKFKLYQIYTLKEFIRLLEQFEHYPCKYCWLAKEDEFNDFDFYKSNILINDKDYNTILEKYPWVTHIIAENTK